MTSVNPLPAGNLAIPTQQEAISVTIAPGVPIFLVGRNGTGKSALINNFAKQIKGNFVYVPGSRSTSFAYETLEMSATRREDFAREFKFQDVQAEARWKPVFGTDRNEKALHDLRKAEMGYKMDALSQIKAEGATSAAIARLQTENSPLDRVNSLLEQANLPIQIGVFDGDLKVLQAGFTYSFARMSDGERAAVILAAEIVAAPVGTTFIIDEPELHLHPSIAVSLVKELVLSRKDCGFLICTHLLELPAEVSESKVLLVRGCAWVNGSVSTWEVDIVDPSEIPEELRIDILGSRRKILFIEGDDQNSLDRPLYALLFPGVSVQPRKTCKDVIKAVEGLRELGDTHRAAAFGLIDNDGMPADLVKKHESRGIYPLPMFSVESLIYSEDVLRAVATVQSNTFGNDVEQLLEVAKRIAMAALIEAGHDTHLASRLAERTMRDKIYSAMPSRKDLVKLTDESWKIEIQSSYPSELERITELIKNDDLEGIISRYPVRESRILNALARGLRFAGREDYESAALKCIERNEDLKGRLKDKLSGLTTQLEHF